MCIETSSVNILMMGLEVALGSVRCRGFVVKLIYLKAQNGKFAPFHTMKAYGGDVEV